MIAEITTDTSVTITIGMAVTLAATIAGYAWRLGVISARISQNTEDIARHRADSDKRFDEVESKHVELCKHVQEAEVRNAELVVEIRNLAEKVEKLREQINTVGGMMVDFLSRSQSKS